MGVIKRGFKVEYFDDALNDFGYGWQLLNICDTLEEAEQIKNSFLSRRKAEIDASPCYLDGTPVSMPIVRIKAIDIDHCHMEMSKRKKIKRLCHSNKTAE